MVITIVDLIWFLLTIVVPPVSPLLSENIISISSKQVSYCRPFCSGFTLTPYWIILTFSNSLVFLFLFRCVQVSLTGTEV